MNKKRDLSTVLLGISVALILWLTILGRERLIGTQIKYYPFHSFISFLEEIQNGRLGANFLGNIILFMPFGFFFPVVALKQRWFWTVAAGAFFSACIEILQLVTSRGCIDLDDVILNVIGTGLGWILCGLLMRRRRKRKNTG